MRACAGLRFLERVVIARDRRQRRAAEVVGDRVRSDEIAIGQPLHQRAGAEAVGAVIGEVRLAQHEQAGNRRHQVVVHPQPAHRVVDGGVDAHRHLVRILVRDPLVHVEQVAVAAADRLDAEALDRVGEVQIHRQAASRRRRGLRRTPPWRRATRRHAARGCRSSDSGARGNSRDRLRESASAAACRPVSSAPRRGRRCGGSPTSASASTGDRR